MLTTHSQRRRVHGGFRVKATIGGVRFSGVFYDDPLLDSDDEEQQALPTAMLNGNGARGADALGPHAVLRGGLAEARRSDGGSADHRGTGQQQVRSMLLL